MIKNPQFLSNQADIYGLLPTLELIILTRFRKDVAKCFGFFNKSQFFVLGAYVVFFQGTLGEIQLKHTKKEEVSHF